MIMNSSNTIKKHNEYYPFDDGMFSYYINKDTGENKFELDPTDIEVEAKLDDFYRGNL